MATFERYYEGMWYAYGPMTLLEFKNLRTILGHPILNGVTFKNFKIFQKIGPFQPGDLVQFEARIHRFKQKVYDPPRLRYDPELEVKVIGSFIDYKVLCPTKAKILERDGKIFNN